MTFEQHIDKAFFQSDHYDKLKHQLLHVRRIMTVQHKSFARRSIESQFSECVTIVTIALHSQTDAISQMRIISKKRRKTYPYSIDHNFTSKEIISIHPLIIPEIPFNHD